MAEPITLQELYEYAQQNRDIEEYGDDYIKKYLPEEIVNKLWQYKGVRDSDEFEWSFVQVRASKDKKGIYISYAGKYLGQGCYETKVYRPETKEYDTIYFG